MVCSVDNFTKTRSVCCISPGICPVFGGGLLIYPCQSSTLRIKLCSFGVQSAQNKSGMLAFFLTTNFSLSHKKKRKRFWTCFLVKEGNWLKTRLSKCCFSGALMCLDVGKQVRCSDTSLTFQWRTKLGAVKTKNSKIILLKKKAVRETTLFGMKVNSHWLSGLLSLSMSAI